MEGYNYYYELDFSGFDSSQGESHHDTEMILYQKLIQLARANGMIDDLECQILERSFS